MPRSKVERGSHGGLDKPIKSPKKLTIAVSAQEAGTRKRDRRTLPNASRSGGWSSSRISVNSSRGRPGRPELDPRQVEVDPLLIVVGG